jgi:hypothetical protein
MQYAGPLNAGDMAVRRNEVAPGVAALLQKQSRNAGSGIYELPVAKPENPDFYNMSLDNVQSQLRNAARTINTLAPEGESLAYINPKEAGILKLLGGAGEPEPVTGIPSFYLGERSDFKRPSKSNYLGESSDFSSGGNPFKGSSASQSNNNRDNDRDNDKDKPKTSAQLNAERQAIQDIVNQAYQDTGVAISDEGRISFASDPDLYKGGGYRYGDKPDDDGKKDEFASGTLGESQKSALDKYIARDIPLKDDKLMQTLAGARLMGDKGLFTSDYNKRLQKSLAAMGLGGKNIFGTYLTPEGRDYYQGLGGGSSDLGDLASNVSNFGVLGLLKNLFGGDPEELSIAERMERAKRAREAMENQQRRGGGNNNQQTPAPSTPDTETEDEEEEIDFFSNLQRRFNMPLTLESLRKRFMTGDPNRQNLLENLSDAVDRAKEENEAST